MHEFGIERSNAFIEGIHLGNQTKFYLKKLSILVRVLLASLHLRSQFLFCTNETRTQSGFLPVRVNILLLFCGMTPLKINLLYLTKSQINTSDVGLISALSPQYYT